jgi:hypothetical protein
MAYMSQENKKALTPAIQAVLKKHNVKGTIAVRHHSTLVVTLQKGLVDFKGKDNVNPYWIAENYADNPAARDLLLELKAAMNTGNFDNSDSMSDYFSVGWYCDIDIGSWKKPYEYVGA